MVSTITEMQAQRRPLSPPHPPTDNRWADPGINPNVGRYSEAHRPPLTPLPPPLPVPLPYSREMDLYYRRGQTLGPHSPGAPPPRFSSYGPPPPSNRNRDPQYDNQQQYQHQQHHQQHYQPSPANHAHPAHHAESAWYGAPPHTRPPQSPHAPGYWGGPPPPSASSSHTLYGQHGPPHSPRPYSSLNEEMHTPIQQQRSSHYDTYDETENTPVPQSPYQDYHRSHSNPSAPTGLTSVPILSPETPTPIRSNLHRTSNNYSHSISVATRPPFINPKTYKEIHSQPGDVTANGTGTDTDTGAIQDTNTPKKANNGKGDPLSVLADVSADITSGDSRDSAKSNRQNRLSDNGVEISRTMSTADESDDGDEAAPPNRTRIASASNLGTSADVEHNQRRPVHPMPAPTSPLIVRRTRAHSVSSPPPSGTAQHTTTPPQDSHKDRVQITPTSMPSAQSIHGHPQHSFPQHSRREGTSEGLSYWEQQHLTYSPRRQQAYYGSDVTEVDPSRTPALVERGSFDDSAVGHGHDSAATYYNQYAHRSNMQHGYADLEGPMTPRRGYGPPPPGHDEDYGRLYGTPDGHGWQREFAPPMPSTPGDSPHPQPWAYGSAPPRPPPPYSYQGEQYDDQYRSHAHPPQSFDRYRHESEPPYYQSFHPHSSPSHAYPRPVAPPNLMSNIEAPYSPPLSSRGYEQQTQQHQSPYPYGPPPPGSEEKTVLRKKFSWKHFPPLERFLIASRDDYLKHSQMNYTAEQKQYNNWLTERLLEVASQNNCEFDPEDFNFVAIRDRIRCYYKSYVQTARKRGLKIFPGKKEEKA